MKRCFQPQDFPNVCRVQTTCFSFSRDGSMVASGRPDGSVLVWNTNSKTLKTKFEVCSCRVQKILFSEDDKYIIVGYDRTVYILDVESNTIVQEIHLWDNGIFSSFSMSSDNKWIAIGNGYRTEFYTLMVLDTKTCEEVETPCGEYSLVCCSVFSNDSNTIVTGFGDGNVQIWDNLSKSRRSIWRAHKGPVYSVAISPNKRWIASASTWDHILKIWDLDTLACLQVFNDYKLPLLRCTKVCLNKKCIVTWLMDGTIHFWEPIFGSFTASIIPLLQANLPPYVVLDIMNQLLAIVNNCSVNLEDKFNHGLKIRQIALLQIELQSKAL